MNKDYYAILGITSGASQEEIKLAYEKMISSFGKLPQSLERKMEIEEAYFILSNLQTRFQYDRIYNNAGHLLKNFDGFDGSKMDPSGLIGTVDDAQISAVPGLNFDIDLDDPEGMLPENFTEIFQAAIKNIVNAANQLKSVQNREENFKNSGDIFLDLPIGSQKAEQGGYFPLEYQRYITCLQCQKKVVAEAQGCPKCEGARRVMAYRRVEIKVPKNTTDGSVLQIANEGHAPSGDLFIKITFRDDFQ